MTGSGAGVATFLVMLLLTTLLTPGTAAAAVPHVLVIATGGTIGSAPGGKSVSGDQLVSFIPELRSVADVSVETVASVGSSALTFADWARLVERIRAAFAANPELTGVVVTHGTDTLEETAFLLDLVIADPRPVVVTGSMRQSTVTSADGPANLLEAIMVAASPQSRDRGTLVVLDDEVHAAAAVTKTNTTRLGTFQSPNQGPIGLISLASGLRYLRPPGRSGHTYALKPEAITALPRVDIVTCYLGGDDALLQAAMKAGAKGVVIAGFGSGTMTPSLDRASAAIAAAGTPVVLSSRVLSGPVHDGSYGVVQRPTDFVRSGLLNPAKSRVLLMVHLAAAGRESLGEAFAPY